MLWYYKNKQSYLYPSHEQYTDNLTELTRKKHYENSQDDSIIPSINFMRTNNISNAACIVPIEDLTVNYGNQNDIDIDFCNENNIPTFYINRSGGAIVLFPGNIAIDAIYTTTSYQMEFNFLSDFKKYLRTKNIEAVIDGNDLLADGKKVIGAVGQVLPEPFLGLTYMGFSISINSNSELIDKICTKPMNKIPGALSDYGITTEEIMDWVLDWFDKHRSWEVEDEV